MIGVKLTQGTGRGTCWWIIILNCTIYYSMKWLKTIKLIKINFVNKYNLNKIQSKLNLLFISKLEMFFLRKNKTFIKSKYSRTRQWSKVIVYFGLWYGVWSVLILLFFCYRYMFIFSYLWWGIWLVLLGVVLKNLKNMTKFILPLKWY